MTKGFQLELAPMSVAVEHAMLGLRSDGVGESLAADRGVRTTQSPSCAPVSGPADWPATTKTGMVPDPAPVVLLQLVSLPFVSPSGGWRCFCPLPIVSRGHRPLLLC